MRLYRPAPSPLRTHPPHRILRLVSVCVCVKTVMLRLHAVGALKPLQQQRLAAVEEQYAEVRGQFDDVASSIDRERLAKVAVEVKSRENTSMERWLWR